MGCILCKFKLFQSEQQSEELVGKEYSWDKRNDVDVEFFMAQHLTNKTVIRKPGTINGQQFVIQNCKSCKILILDYTATVTIDDCVNCFILLGPVKSRFIALDFSKFVNNYPSHQNHILHVVVIDSVFLRDSTDCKVAMSCQQFRSRDCKRIELFLHCSTQPIIEASVAMKFACLQCYYPGLSMQLELSGLSRFNNNWSDIYDFTPVPGEKNFSYLPNGVTFNDQLTDQETELGISVDPLQSCIPLTLGKRSKPFGETCMVVYFKENNQLERVQSFLKLVHNESCMLVQTKEIHLSMFEAERLFGKSFFSSLAVQGNLISLEINGVDACKVCSDAVEREAMHDNTSSSEVFISNSYDSDKLLTIFYNLAQVQTSV